MRTINQLTALTAAIVAVASRIAATGADAGIMHSLVSHRMNILAALDIDSLNGRIDLSPDYILFGTSQEGRNAVSFSGAITSNNFGTGPPNPSGRSALPSHDGTPKATLHSGRDTRLAYGAGKTFKTGAGNPLSVTGAVPEPATRAMMSLGLGSAGFAVRRRQRTVTTSAGEAA